MSEYWKSTPKYWCKHCSTFVKDTPFERKQHENTGKHQGNLKRFLRGIQNDHERNERDKQKAKEEVERLNRVVGGQATMPGLAANTPSLAPSRKTGISALTAADQKRQWSQLAEMGIVVPEGFRGEMAMSGDWQTISRKVEEDDSTEEVLSKGVRKRKLDDQEIDEEQVGGSTTRRGWGSSFKRYPGQESGADLDKLLNTPLLKKDPESSSKMENNDSRDGTLNRSDFTAPEVTQASTKEVNLSAVEDGDITQPLVKEEDSGHPGDRQTASQEEVADVPVFKKRKARVR